MAANAPPAGVPVLDFHAHFPARRATGEADRVRAEYIARFGEDRWQVIDRHLQADQAAWRKTWNFPKPEPPGGDDEMAARVGQLRGGAHDAAERAACMKSLTFRRSFLPGADSRREQASTP